MRRTAAIVVGLAVVLSLGVGALVGNMAGGGRTTPGRTAPATAEVVAPGTAAATPVGRVGTTPGAGVASPVGADSASPQAAEAPARPDGSPGTGST